MKHDASICPRCDGGGKLQLKHAAEYGYIEKCSDCNPIEAYLAINFMINPSLPITKETCLPKHYCDECNEKLEERLRMPCRICKGDGIVWRKFE